MTVELKNEVRMVDVSESDTAKTAEARGHTILILQKRIEMIMAGKPLDLCLIDSMGVTVYGNLEEISYRIALAFDKSKDIEGIFDRAGDIYESGVDNYERPLPDNEPTPSDKRDGHVTYRDILMYVKLEEIPLVNNFIIKEIIKDRGEFLENFEDTDKGDAEKKQAADLVLTIAGVLDVLQLDESENEDIFARFQAIMTMMMDKDRLDFKKEIEQDYKELTKILTEVSVKLGKEAEVLKVLIDSIKE